MLFVIGKIGIIRFDNISIKANWTWQTVATVDEEYKPILTMSSSLKGERVDNTNGDFYAAIARIQPTGAVSINPGNYAGNSLYGELVYIIA